jgi:hypothetical protein
MSVELGDRRFGLFVQVVEQRNVPAQRLLVTIELDGDAVDLRGDIVELLGEPAQTPLGRGEQTTDETGVPQACRVEATRLAENIGK